MTFSLLFSVPANSTSFGRLRSFWSVTSVDWRHSFSSCKEPTKSQNNWETFSVFVTWLIYHADVNVINLWTWLYCNFLPRKPSGLVRWLKICDQTNEAPYTLRDCKKLILYRAWRHLMYLLFLKPIATYIYQANPQIRLKMFYLHASSISHEARRFRKYILVLLDELVFFFQNRNLKSDV